MGEWRLNLYKLSFCEVLKKRLFQGAGVLLSQPRNAHLKFTGDMKKAFELLTDSMDNKGDAKLLSHGKFEQTYHDGADMLRETSDLGATEYNTKVAEKVKKKLDALTKDSIPKKLNRFMKDMVDICSKFLAQNAEFNKKKGPAFKMLMQAMRNKPNDKLFQKGKVQMTNSQAADNLEQARGLDTDHDDPNLSQAIHGAMSKLVDDITPGDMKKEMAETLDHTSKYLSQKAMDENERGPAFDLLVKELNKRGGEPFSDYPALSTKHAAAYTLTSAPGLANVQPDPATAPEFKQALHLAIDPTTPTEMQAEMNDVIERCGDYLSGFIRDRGPAMDALLGMMKSNPKNVFAKRNDYTMDYETAAQETENAPTLVSYLPVKDIADEGKEHLTKDMKNVTPTELKVPMQTLIQDVSKFLSQPMAMRSGVAGERYPMNFLTAVKKSLGEKPLYKYKDYGQTYADAAEELKHAGPMESAMAFASQMGLHSNQSLVSQENLASEQNRGSEQEPTQSIVNLKHEIASEMKRGVPSRLAPSIVEGLHSSIDKAAKHLAKIGTGKGKALEYIVDLMKKKGESPLGKMQGYEQTHSDGARRIENSPNLTNEKVDKGTYEAVKGKLTAMTSEEPGGKHMEHLPGMVDESSKYLSAPVPETLAEKRTVLADLMGRKEDELIGEDGIYKMTYTEGGDEIKNAPVGVTEAHDQKKKEEMLEKIEAVIPDKKMAEILKESTKEGAAHLTDVVKGRGEAMEVIHDSLKKEKQKEFVEVGEFKKTHEEVADMLVDAPNFNTKKPSPVIMENVEHKVAILPKDVPPDKKMAKEHMEDATKIVANYIAAEATKESGLTPKELAALDEAGFNAEAKAAAEERRLAAIAGGVGKKVGASADGKAVGGVGADGKPIGGVGADGKPIGGVGADGKPIAGVGADGKPIGGVGTDGKPIGGVGADGKPIIRLGADGKPVGGVGADGKPIGGIGADGKPIGGIGADGKPIVAVGADGKPIVGIGADGKPIGADGKTTGGVGTDGTAAGRIGPDGKVIGAAGLGGKETEEEGAGGPVAGGKRSDAGGKRMGAGGVSDARGYGPGGVGQDKSGSWHGPDESSAPVFGSETEEQRRRRLAEAEEYRKYEEAERKRLGDKEYFRRQAEKSAAAGGKYHGGALGADYDPEHEAALDILHRELRARGPEVFYEQPQTSLTHAQASHWLSMPYPMRVDKTVRESADTARLYKKFEKKLGSLVSRVTPPDLFDSMQDVVIEGAQRLSEFFVATNFKAQVHEALISEMQMRGNEILTEVDGAAETFFFAAQRLKKSKAINIQEPCYRVAHHLSKKLEDMVRTRPMPRKLLATMKDHVKGAADYLSALVTKPDDQIEAYVALLGEMEAAGDSQLIDGDIPKSHKEAASYLRQLTTFEDKIGLPNMVLQSSIQRKLRSLMSNVPPSGYSPHVMESVIADSAGLLVSYIMLQGEKTEALKALVHEINQAGDSVLLRHGPIRKSFKDGADLLRGKSADQLSVPTADPVVARKIQIKLNNLMFNKTPERFQALMDDVIEDTTMFLAVQLLQPQLIQVCKCMKNVFVQCELWCDEILRRVTRPCCTCSRHVSAQALQDLAPTQRLHVSPGNSHVFAPGIEISFTPCPAKPNRAPSPRRGENLDLPKVCPALNPTPGCLQNPTTSYLLYSTSYKRFGNDSRLMRDSPSSSSGTQNYSPMSSSQSRIPLSKYSSPLKRVLDDIHSDNARFLQPQQELQCSEPERRRVTEEAPSYFTTPSTFTSGTTQGTRGSFPNDDEHYPTSMFSNVQVSDNTSARITQAKSGYSSRTPIISTDKMADWHAMMVSLMWNVQAWRDWIQEIVDRALVYQHNPNITREETADSWTSFHRRVLTEALQWRQYSIFSRQLTTRLVQRYKDKEIVSPMGAIVKTKTYLECQQEMLTIIDIFNRWTQWLTLVVKETDSLQPVTDSDMPLQGIRWNHLKKKVQEYSKDWAKYILYLKVSWEQKYGELIADFLPLGKEPGPVWVVSACGAVPSGAVAAGVYDGEVIWVARTTHRCNVLPAALFPSKHCCLVYADGAVHRYTKYQVMCNAEVRWVAWRGGSVGGRAVRVAAGVHVGRVHYRGDHLLGAVHEPHYRCQVVIFGRPFAFNCYELLMLAGEDEQ